MAGGLDKDALWDNVFVSPRCWQRRNQLHGDGADDRAAGLKALRTLVCLDGAQSKAPPAGWHERLAQRLVRPTEGYLVAAGGEVVLPLGRSTRRDRKEQLVALAYYEKRDPTLLSLEEILADLYLSPHALDRFGGRSGGDANKRLAEELLRNLLETSHISVPADTDPRKRSTAFDIIVDSRRLYVPCEYGSEYSDRSFEAKSVIADDADLHALLPEDVARLLSIPDTVVYGSGPERSTEEFRRAVASTQQGRLKAPSEADRRRLGADFILEFEDGRRFGVRYADGADRPLEVIAPDGADAAADSGESTPRSPAPEAQQLPPSAGAKGALHRRRARLAIGALAAFVVVGVVLAVALRRGQEHPLIVLPGQQVVIDRLAWRLRSAMTARALADSPSTKPHGRFVIVGLEIGNHSKDDMTVPEPPPLRISAREQLSSDPTATALVGEFPTGYQMFAGATPAHGVAVYDVPTPDLSRAQLALPRANGRDVRLDLGLGDKIGEVAAGTLKGATSQGLPILFKVTSSNQAVFYASGQAERRALRKPASIRISYFKVYVRARNGSSCWISGHPNQDVTHGSFAFNAPTEDGGIGVFGQFSTSFDAQGHLEGKFGKGACPTDKVVWTAHQVAKAGPQP